MISTGEGISVQAANPAMNPTMKTIPLAIRSPTRLRVKKRIEPVTDPSDKPTSGAINGASSAPSTNNEGESSQTPRLRTRAAINEKKKKSNVGETRCPSVSKKVSCSDSFWGSRVRCARRRRAGGKFSGSSGVCSVFGKLINFILCASHRFGALTIHLRSVATILKGFSNSSRAV